jgi:hypothetical protein
VPRPKGGAWIIAVVSNPSAGHIVSIDERDLALRRDLPASVGPSVIDGLEIDREACGTIHKGNIKKLIKR